MLLMYYRWVHNRVWAHKQCEDQPVNVQPRGLVCAFIGWRPWSCIWNEALLNSKHGGRFEKWSHLKVIWISAATYLTAWLEMIMKYFWIVPIIDSSLAKQHGPVVSQSWAGNNWGIDLATCLNNNLLGGFFLWLVNLFLRNTCVVFREPMVSALTAKWVRKKKLLSKF